MAIITNECVNDYYAISLQAISKRQLNAYYAEFAKAKAALYEDARRWKINLKTLERDGVKL